MQKIVGSVSVLACDSSNRKPNRDSYWCLKRRSGDTSSFESFSSRTTHADAVIIPTENCRSRRFFELRQCPRIMSTNDFHYLVREIEFIESKGAAPSVGEKGEGSGREREEIAARNRAISPPKFQLAAFRRFTALVNPTTVVERTISPPKSAVAYACLRATRFHLARPSLTDLVVPPSARTKMARMRGALPG